MSGPYISTTAGGVINGGNVVAIGPTAPNYSTLSQNLGPLVIGQTYFLSFYIGNPASTSSCSLIVTVGSTRLLSTNNTALSLWTPYNLTFVANATNATLSFSAFNTPDYYYISYPTLRTPLSPPPPSNPVPPSPPSPPDSCTCSAWTCSNGTRPRASPPPPSAARSTFDLVSRFS